MIRAQTISYYLGRPASDAHPRLTRSRYITTRIRGWGKLTAGFEATQWSTRPGVVKVEYVHGDWATYQSDAERRRRRDDMLQSYKDRLESLGFLVEWDREHHFLMVEGGDRS